MSRGDVPDDVAAIRGELETFLNKKDADGRIVIMHWALDKCLQAKLDPAEHGARLFCIRFLRAIERAE